MKYYVKKRDIDTEFLTIVNHLRKIVLKSFNKNFLLDTGILLNLDKQEILDSITNRDILGFHLFKNFEVNSQTLKKQIDNIISISGFKKEKILPLVKFKEWLDRYNAFTNNRTYPDLFIRKNELTGFKLISSNDLELPDRKILGKILDDHKMLVYDFGDILQKDKILYATYDHQINQNYIENYSNLIYDYVKITNEWLDRTGGEFIIDTFNHFEMK